MFLRLVQALESIAKSLMAILPYLQYLEHLDKLKQLQTVGGELASLRVEHQVHRDLLGDMSFVFADIRDRDTGQVFQQPVIMPKIDTSSITLELSELVKETVTAARSNVPEQTRTGSNITKAQQKALDVLIAYGKPFDDWDKRELQEKAGVGTAAVYGARPYYESYLDEQHELAS